MLEVPDDEYDVGKEMKDLQVVQRKIDELKSNDGEASLVVLTELDDINNTCEDIQERGFKSYEKDAKDMIVTITERVAKGSKHVDTINT